MIHPFDERYRTEIADIFEEQSRYNKMLQVELALAQVHCENGIITQDEYNSLESSKDKVTANLIKEIEKETHHETMALVEAFTRVSGCDKVHIGATSSDILDTALALQLKEAHSIIMRELHSFKDVLLEKAKETKSLICIGRTHGQFALPMTFGLKFALWAYELVECIEELDRMQFYGKMSGAVGTFASFGKRGFEIQKKVLSKLGLIEPLVSNQVVSRLHIAQYLFNIITVVSIIDKIAREFRNLQRSEILEIREPFTEKQTGSSTMPHKRNPVKSENLCSLAKRLRTNILPALENISLEHERDLTNSANERIIIPETIILTHYMIRNLIEIISGMEFLEENITKNIQINPAIYMEKKMMDLIIEEGFGRQEAYQQAQNNTLDTDPRRYIGLSEQIVDRVIKSLQ
jgi:adenylosuccinate lyase